MAINMTAKELGCGCAVSLRTEPERTTTPPTTDVIIEPCPSQHDVHIDGCKDTVEVDAGTVELASLGRILQVDVTVKNVCPGKRLALAVILVEVDSKGNEYKRGLKTLVIPAHSRETCRDVTVRCIKFVVPEELDVSGQSDALCDRRNFKVRLLANYIDDDFECCKSTT